MRLRAAINCAAFLLASLATAQNANHWENLFTASDALDGSETLILQLTTGTCLSGPTPVPSNCQRFVSPQDIADFIGVGADTFLAVEVDGTPESTLAPTINFQGVDFVLVESPADTFALTINSGIARDTELHVAVVIAGTPNYIVASGTDNQTLTLGLIDLATDVTGLLPNANLADMATDTIKMRNAAGPGPPEDLKISALTDNPSPGATDSLLAETAAGDLVRIQVGNLPTGLTVEEADGAPTVADVVTIQFNQADGLTVADETGGQVQIDLTLSGDASGSGGATIVTAVQPNAVALSTDTTGNYAAGDAEAGNATSLAADALDAMAEIAAGIKRGPDATDTHLLTTDVAAPGALDCLQMDTDGSVVLTGAPCGGGAFDDSGDPIVQNTTSKRVEFGLGAGTLVGAVEMGSGEDEPQLVIECDDVQTDDCLIIQNSADIELVAISAAGDMFFRASGSPTILNRDATATQATLIPSSDVDTGIGANQNNQLSLITNNTEQMRITNEGQHLLNSRLDAATTDEVGWTHTCTINKATSGADTCAVFNRVDTASPGPSLIAAFRLENVDQLTINEVGTLRGLPTNSAVSVSAGDDTAGNLGALTSFKSATATINSSAAATLTASNLIPAGAFLMGLTARITTGFGTTTGLTDFDVGDGSDVDRWANSLAITSGTTMDLTNATANASGDFPSAQDVVLTAVGGNFDATGTIELLAHYISLTAPTG